MMFIPAFDHLALRKDPFDQIDAEPQLLMHRMRLTRSDLAIS